MGSADSTGERRVGGIGLVESTNCSVGRESVEAAGNHNLQQRVASARIEICRIRGNSNNNRDRRGNGEGVARRGDIGGRTMLR